MFSDALEKQAIKVLDKMRAKNMKFAAAESCTGGLLTALLTHISGSSDVVECGFITYSNASKTYLLGVSAELINQYGAVSSIVAKDMAEGVIAKTGKDISISITGIAGPSGGSELKPVGLVYIGLAQKTGETEVKEFQFSGSRQNIRLCTVREAIRMVEKVV
jgi:nicotinamide-nucleotide amidase